MSIDDLIKSVEEFWKTVPQDEKNAIARSTEQEYIIKKLEKLWYKQPELRLCQMLENMLSTPEHKCNYYVTDKELEKVIDKKLKEFDSVPE